MFSPPLRIYQLSFQACAHIKDIELLTLRRANLPLEKPKSLAERQVPWLPHQDEPGIDRANQTQEYESPCDSNLSLDPEQLNPCLPEWIIKYDLNRAHRSLRYLDPIDYIEGGLAKVRSPVLPMWSASTLY